MSNQESCKHIRRNFLSGIATGSGLLLAGNGGAHRRGGQALGPHHGGLRGSSGQRRNGEAQEAQAVEAEGVSC